MDAQMIWSLTCTLGALTLRVFAIVILADVAIASAHHLMDRYGDPGCSVKWLARIFEANRLHHAYPNAFLKKSPLANASETLLIGGVILVLAWVFGSLSWQVWLFATAISVSAVVHRWQHMPAKNVPWLFGVMRRCGLVQSRRQHMDHHRFHNISYAVLTNLANVILERTKMLRVIEWLIGLLGRHPYDLDAISQDTRRQSKNDA